MEWEPTYEQTLALVKDAEFQRRMRTDETLNRLYREKDQEPEDELKELLVFMGKCLLIGGKAPVAAPTAGVIAMLAIIKSPYVTNDYGSFEDLDTDKALWVLTMGKKAFNYVADPLTDLGAICGGFVSGLGLNHLDAWNDIRQAIRQAFAPLRMLPRDGEPNEFNRPYFDCHWLAGVVLRISRITSEPLDRVLWEIPLVTLNHLAVCDDQWNGVKGIGRVTKLDEAGARCEEMKKQRLSEMGLL
jgi:hypothetical protein